MSRTYKRFSCLEDSNEQDENATPKSMSRQPQACGCHADSGAGLLSAPRLPEEASSGSLCDNSQQALGSSTGSLSGVCNALNLSSPIPCLFYPFPCSLPLRMFSLLMLTFRITPTPCVLQNHHPLPPTSMPAVAIRSSSSISAAAHDPLHGAAIFYRRKTSMDALLRLPLCSCEGLHCRTPAHTHLGGIIE